jgi:peptidoglycan/LPS O-acetylase OafA/YrhL
MRASVPPLFGLCCPSFEAAFLAAEWLDPGPAYSVREWSHWLLTQVLPLVPLTAIVAAFSRGVGGTVGKLAELPPLLSLGRISYGVYLYHPILLAYAVKAQPWIPLNVSEQGPGRFLVAGTATIVVASISWMVFEKPLSGLKRHFPYVVRGHGAVRPGRQVGGPVPSLQRTEARR